ncbi:MAG: hypothetical protein M3347_12880 [Armatimonadota bacterium]|nr:hypothetical protein [Armatimonadota bacterium]
MGLGAIGSYVNLLREVNLKAIKQEAEREFRLLVTGEPMLAALSAERLSAEPGKTGIHPWLVGYPLPLQPRDFKANDLALIVVHEPDLDKNQADAVRRLHDARIPVVVVVVSDTARQKVGAELPRPGETARVILSPSLDQEEFEEQLLPALVQAAPENLRLALARQLPVLRAPIAHALIEESSRANAVYVTSTALAEVIPALTLPLNVADVVVLTKNQLLMAYKIALAFGKQGTPREIIGEIIGVVGSGLLFRQVAREMVGLIPVVGVVPKIAVSYAGTWVIGQTIYVWASRGEKLSRSEIRQFYAESLSKGRALADKLVDKLRRPALPAPDGEDEGGDKVQG